MSSSDTRHMTWSDPFYPYALDRLSCMHYFEFSPFFTQDSTNTIARRSNLDPGQPGVIESFPPGQVEFLLEKEQPPHLFVIRKQQRSPSPTSPPTILGHYYILDKVIYQAPTIQEVLAARAQRCSSMLQQSFEKLREDLEPLHQMTKKEQLLQEAAAAATSMEVEGEDLASSFKWVTKSNDKGGRRRRAYSEAEETRMNRAANMIDSVLSQLPLPRLPAEYVEKMPEHLRPPVTMT